MQLNWLLWLAGTTTELYTLKADSSSKIEAKHLFAELHFFYLVRLCFFCFPIVQTQTTEPHLKTFPFYLIHKKIWCTLFDPRYFLSNNYFHYQCKRTTWRFYHHIFDLHFLRMPREALSWKGTFYFLYRYYVMDESTFLTSRRRHFPECSDEGTYTECIHNSITRSHVMHQEQKSH
jgi:hypothetical protein